MNLSSEFSAPGGKKTELVSLKTDDGGTAKIFVNVSQVESESFSRILASINVNLVVKLPEFALIKAV